MVFEYAFVLQEHFGAQVASGFGRMQHLLRPSGGVTLFAAATGSALLIRRFLRNEVVLFHGVPMTEHAVRDLNRDAKRNVAAIAKENAAAMPTETEKFDYSVSSIRRATRELDEAVANHQLKETLDGLECATNERVDDFFADCALAGIPGAVPDPAIIDFGKDRGPAYWGRREWLKNIARLDQIRCEFVEKSGDKTMRRRLIVAYAVALARQERRYDGQLTHRLRRAFLICELADHVRAQFGGAAKPRNDLNERDARAFITAYLNNHDEYRKLPAEWKVAAATQALPLCYVRGLDELVAEQYAARHGALLGHPAQA
jgi:hypothetical protein